MVVRFFTPFLTRARMRFSGLPHRPKPPIMMLAPSGTSRTASSALATTLFIRGGFYFRGIAQRKLRNQPQRTQRAQRNPIRKARLLVENPTFLFQMSSSRVELSIHLFPLWPSVSSVVKDFRKLF